MEPEYCANRGPGDSPAVTTDATRRGLQALIACRPERLWVQGCCVMALGADGPSRAQAWAELTGGGLVVEWLPAGHSDMVRAPFVSMVARAIRNETRAKR
jgi:thioesterase domain-containing protein